MATYALQKQFKGLRANTGRRKGRDPWATGFEDDSDEDRRRNRTKPVKPLPVTKPSPITPPTTGVASPVDKLRDSEDEFLDPPASKKDRTDRYPSPAPHKVAQSRVSLGAGRRGSNEAALASAASRRKAVALAAGPLAYLDDSEDEEVLPRTRRLRHPSPPPRRRSDSPASPDRSNTPRGDRRTIEEPVAPPRHTVASPFAGTKYLQDSDSEDEERRSAQRQGSTDSSESTEAAGVSPVEPEGPGKNHLEATQAPKRRSRGSGVSWKTISAGRSEQRQAEVDALQANLRKRGRLISFSTHAVTDEGRRVPLAPSYERPRLSVRGRGKSPPRRFNPNRSNIDDELPNGQLVPVPEHDNYTTKAFPGMTNVEIRVETKCH